jgi:hypothetical protein
MLIMPVANGVLPRPGGGKISGAFVMEQGGTMLAATGVGQDILICPWVVDEQNLYPVGVVARLADLAEQSVPDPNGGAPVPVMLVYLEGRGHARWHGTRSYEGALFAADIERLNFKHSRKEYPVISGAGWMPEGGTTEFRDESDIPVSLYGTDLETGRKVNLTGNLGGLVRQDQAHTIEHSIIRALRTFGLCTAKTLASAMSREGEELKRSVETSIRYALPEVLGLTATGACGNPLTNLAQLYLSTDMLDNLTAGQTLDEALYKARRKVMSQITQDIGLTTQPGIRAIQGMKRGMSHDDTPLRLETAKKVIARFPLSPWE